MSSVRERVSRRFCFCSIGVSALHTTFRLWNARILIPFALDIQGHFLFKQPCVCRISVLRTFVRGRTLTVQHHAEVIKKKILSYSSALSAPLRWFLLCWLQGLETVTVMSVHHTLCTVGQIRARVSSKVLLTKGTQRAHHIFLRWPADI